MVALHRYDELDPAFYDAKARVEAMDDDVRSELAHVFPSLAHVGVLAAILDG